MSTNPSYLVDRPLADGDVALIIRSNGDVQMLGASPESATPEIEQNFTKIMALYAAVMQPHILVALLDELEKFVEAGHLKLPEATH